MTKRDRRALLLHACEELIGNGSLSVIEEVFSPDYVAHAGGKSHKGHAFLRRFTKQLRVSISRLRVVEIEFLAECPKSISWRRILAGTHKENLRGIPPSGKSLKWEEIVVTRFEGDLVAEEWLVSDLAAQLLLKLGKEGINKHGK